MKVGLHFVMPTPTATAEVIASMATAAEERGFSSLWIGEHPILFEEHTSKYPYTQDGKIPDRQEHRKVELDHFGLLEQFSVLTFVAAHTERIRLGTGITLVPQRNPVYTAKSVATLDWLSGGRLNFGVGVCWHREEYEALGGTRWEQRAAECREYLEVMRSLWTDAYSSHSGPMYELPECRCYPKPLQQPHPPIYFGGETEPALRRVADLGTGWYGVDLSTANVGPKVTRLRELLEERGRTLDEIHIAVSPPNWICEAADLEVYAQAGAEEIILRIVAEPDVAKQHAALDAMVRDYMEPAAKL